jgi:hypothetical protein
MPDKDNTIEDIEEMDEDILDAVPVREKIQNADGLYGADDIDILEKAEEENQDESYPNRIRKALEFLEQNKSTILSKSRIVNL